MSFKMIRVTNDYDIADKMSTRIMKAVKTWPKIDLKYLEWSGIGYSLYFAMTYCIKSMENY